MINKPRAAVLTNRKVINRYCSRWTTVAPFCQAQCQWTSSNQIIIDDSSALKYWALLYWWLSLPLLCGLLRDNVDGQLSVEYPQSKNSWLNTDIVLIGSLATNTLRCSMCELSSDELMMRWRYYLTRHFRKQWLWILRNNNTIKYGIPKLDEADFWTRQD